MVICKQKVHKLTNKLKINAAGYGVNQVQKVKVLGFYIQSNLQNNSQINKIISNINNRLFNIKKLGNQTNIKSRIILTKAIVIGKLNYALPLLCNSNLRQL